MTEREILKQFNEAFKTFVAADESPQTFPGNARDAADTAWSRMVYLSGEAENILAPKPKAKEEK